MGGKRRSLSKEFKTRLFYEHTFSYGDTVNGLQRLFVH